MKPPAGGRGNNYEFILCKKRLQDQDECEQPAKRSKSIGIINRSVMGVSFRINGSTMLQKYAKNVRKKICSKKSSNKR